MKMCGKLEHLLIFKTLIYSWLIIFELMIYNKNTMILFTTEAINFQPINKLLELELIHLSM